MTRRLRIRSGFSLIELLVVIALLSILAALAAGTFFRIRSGQLVSTTETNLQKINTGLDRIWSAERDRAEKQFVEKNLPDNIPYNALLTFAGGPNEVERAKAVWMLMKMKQQFPQTFTEARTPRTFSAGTLSITIPTVQTFAAVPNTAPANADDAANQAAVLLFLILTEKGSRGELFQTDSLNAFIKDVSVSGYTGKVFVDAYGIPITYARFFTNDEVNDAPYTRLPLATVNADPKKSNNPFDFTARLVGTDAPAWTNRALFHTASGISVGDMKRNFMATAISAGPNKIWDSLDVRGGSASPFNNVGLVNNTLAAGATDDNIFGFRLRKQAARGD